MRSQIEELRAYQQQSGCVLGALVSDDHSSQVIDWLRNGESLKNISHDLKKPSHASKKEITTYPGLNDGQTIDAATGPTRGIPNLRLEKAQGSISAVQQAKDQTPLCSLLGLNSMIDFMAGTNNDLIEWAPDTVMVLITLSQYPALGHWHEQTTDHTTLGSTVLYARDQGQAAIFGHESGGDHSDQKSFGPLSWINVRQLVDHLIALYFCWEYPTFVSLSKEHFLEAYKTGDRNYYNVT